MNSFLSSNGSSTSNNKYMVEIKMVIMKWFVMVFAIIKQMSNETDTYVIFSIILSLWKPELIILTI